MFTSGPAEGVAIGICCEEPLYHASLRASLRPVEYDRLLAANGFVVREYIAEDPHWRRAHGVARNLRYRSSYGLINTSTAQTNCAFS
jgi:hypothetical protein